MKKLFFIPAALIAATTAALTGGALKLDAMKVIKPEELVWRDNPNFTKGAQLARLIGDATKPEMFINRSKFPPNYRVPPHTHPVPEVVLVISGTLCAMGEKFEQGERRVVEAGFCF